MKPVVAMTTTSSEKEANLIAGMLVKEKLAACVQIIPNIHSIYEWEGKLRDDSEFLLLIKTGKKSIGAIKKVIKEVHSYEVPEFLVLPVKDGSDLYLEWMKNMTR